MPFKQKQKKKKKKKTKERKKERQSEREREREMYSTANDETTSVSYKPVGPVLSPEEATNKEDGRREERDERRWSRRREGRFR
ncbi:hypothetical protein ANTPLA_LOCUS1111 [Anthophora plagiata]